MKLIAPMVLAASLLLSPVATDVSQATPLSAHEVARHACTRTSSGSCIRGGEFCPQAKYGHFGWDAKGRRYKCKGNRTHPHWMK